MAKKFFFLVLSLLVVCGLSSCLFLYHWLHSPEALQTTPVEYNLVEGSSFDHLAHELSKQNVINHPRLFVLCAKFLGITRTIPAGTYLFDVNTTPEEALLKLMHGDVYTIKYTIPEGINMYQVAATLLPLYPNTTMQDWLHIMDSKEMVAYISPALRAPNVEGFLFPQTYFLNPNSTPEQVIKIFISEFKKRLTPQLVEKLNKSGLNLLQAVTLASIIERETAVPAERGMIAGVYLNRLHKRMRLQADPTVIYGIWKRYAGSLRKKDLLQNTPYNTYVHYGLPPGPIANPSMDSLWAITNPQSDALYFVAKGDGTHIFSNTLTKHNAAVKKYIHYLQEKNSTKAKETKVSEQ